MGDLTKDWKKKDKVVDDNKEDILIGLNEQPEGYYIHEGLPGVTICWTGDEILKVIKK